jgi:hypothetical protein
MGGIYHIFYGQYDFLIGEAHCAVMPGHGGSFRSPMCRAFPRLRSAPENEMAGTSPAMTPWIVWFAA